MMVNTEYINFQKLLDLVRCIIWYYLHPLQVWEEMEEGKGKCKQYFRNLSLNMATGIEQRQSTLGHLPSMNVILTDKVIK